jgi:hypothetical protein
LDNGVKTFHFIEVNWLVYFPKNENRGKYANYMVNFTDKKEVNQLQTRMVLGELLDKPEISENYPHTVGYFKSNSENNTGNSEYLEIRIVRMMEEFWAFLNSVDI